MTFEIAYLNEIEGRYRKCTIPYRRQTEKRIVTHIRLLLKRIMFSGVSYMSTYSSNTETRIIPHIHNPTMRTTPHNEKRIMPHIHNTAKRMIPHNQKRKMPYS